jgi:hypothetical protein
VVQNLGSVESHVSDYRRINIDNLRRGALPLSTSFARATCHIAADCPIKRTSVPDYQPYGVHGVPFELGGTKTVSSDTVSKQVGAEDGPQSLDVSPLISSGHVIAAHL